MFAMPPVTRALIIANVAVYLLQRFAGPSIEQLFALWPLGSGCSSPGSCVTYAFLHDPTSVAHIFFNMFALYMFGRALESYMGRRRFVIFYLACVLAAALTQLAVQCAAERGRAGDRGLGRRVRRAAGLRLVLPARSA